MKPDWDRLAVEYDGHATILVGDVDCTASGKPLCDSNGVKGFPTIKHGAVSNLQDYKGGRDYAELSKFAKTLKPACSPAAIELCNGEEKASIEKFQAMSSSELNEAIAALDQRNADAERKFKADVEKLQKQYESLSKAKDAELESVKSEGLGLMKAVSTHKKASGHDEL